ncbi:MAG TPA: hypothetical protein VMS40_09310 [Vicinamibacterales bacterium]|nr:hypothetical protein [Vicinamibacterales bacterium]
MPRRVGVATVTTYRYRADVLEQLERHGVRPTSSTRPELVHEFVSDLYRYELRRLRGRLVRREIPKDGYFERVVALRRLYPLVSLKPPEWLVEDGS